MLLRKLRKIFFSSDSLVYAELSRPKGSNIQTGAGNCNVVRRSDFSKEFRSSHSSRTEVTGLRRWVGKRKIFGWIAEPPCVARSQPKRRTHPKTIFGCENNFHFAGRHALIYTQNTHDKRKIKPSHPPEGCFLRVEPRTGLLRSCKKHLFTC